MKLKSLDHIHLMVDPGQIEHARTFYIGLLGFVEIPKPESLKELGGFWATGGDSEIHIGLEVNAGRAKTSAHSAFSVEDMDGYENLLRQNGVELLDATPIEGRRRFYFRDPFGNLIEFLEYDPSE